VNEAEVTSGWERMKKDVGPRFWVEIALASLTAVLFLVTLLWRDWIELVFGAYPDGGSGQLEWAVVGGLLLATLLLAALARASWRRAVVREA
jgi:hypothetical protein